LIASWRFVLLLLRSPSFIMVTNPSLEDLPRPLFGALSRRGFSSLTQIQQAVLAPDTEGRDLQLSSQTGSGKTLAIGFVILRDLNASKRATTPIAHADKVETTAGPEPTDDATAQHKSLSKDRHAPSKGAKGALAAAIVVVPTRELAAQVSKELAWLMKTEAKRCCTITGGASYSMQMRALKEQPDVIVGTPGRLRDHIERGHIDLADVRSVVLDEADQMLDMGFRDDLEAIVDKAGPHRRMHMASATFPPDALALALRYQTDPKQIFGTAPGEVNHDISHVAHLVRTEDRLSALINLLLLAPHERALIFVRTRVDASNLATRLSAAGFSARPISGDLEQKERTRTLDAFRSGILKVLVATDVAARGLDIPNVGRVIHADPPGDSEVFTHRSGRTGRAGNTGLSVLIVTPDTRESVTRIAARAKIKVKWTPAPSADAVWSVADERFMADLKQATDRVDAHGPDERWLRFTALAERLMAEHEDPTALIRELLLRCKHAGPSEPRKVEPLPLTPMGKPKPRNSRVGRDTRFVPFHITWGTRFGANVDRLLAMVCRRGNIRGNQIGAIRLGETFSTFEVSASVATAF
ncbi:MAG: hypothetical protein CSA75_04215, partial [Sorangium cellulosum]